MLQGFSPETIDFLWGIRFNNNREWFAAHKEQYQRTLYEPMKALSAAVAAHFSDVPELRMHLSRIYRDMRMHPSTYYKDSLWFHLEQDGHGAVLESPLLCFDINPEGYRFGFLLACARASQMDALRRRMLERPEEFLRLVTRAERESGAKLGGDRYKRPKPCPDERLTPYFSLKNFIAIVERAPDDLLFSLELVGEVCRVLRAWLPLYEFCMRI